MNFHIAASLVPGPSKGCEMVQWLCRATPELVVSQKPTRNSKTALPTLRRMVSSQHQNRLAMGTWRSVEINRWDDLPRESWQPQNWQAPKAVRRLGRVDHASLQEVLIDLGPAPSCGASQRDKVRLDRISTRVRAHYFRS